MVDILRHVLVEQAGSVGDVFEYQLAIDPTGHMTTSLALELGWATQVQDSREASGMVQQQLLRLIVYAEYLATSNEQSLRCWSCESLTSDLSIRYSAKRTSSLFASWVSRNT